jgi:GTP cyclohydrolase I
VVGGALFHEPEVATAGSGLVIVRDVDFASTSESSLLPFYGRCHIGYMPSQGIVLGLSKVARLVTMFARRLQTQERFTQELLVAFEAEVLPQVHAASVLGSGGAAKPAPLVQECEDF